MVSVKTLFAVGAALLASVTSTTAAVTQINSIRDYDTPCGVEPVPGIRQPANGTTFTYTQEDQDNYNGLTFEIIYCSGDYFKTSSLNVTAALSTTMSGGMVIGSAKPSPNAAAGGYYGYIFNVTVYPNQGFLDGTQKLSIFEVETGYYNPYNFRISTITVDFEIPDIYAS